MKLKATFYYKGSGCTPTFRTVEVLGIHKPRKRGADWFANVYDKNGRKLTIFGYEIVDGALPQFKTYHVEKCSGLVIKLVGTDQVAGDTFDPEQWDCQVYNVADALRELAKRVELEG